MSVHVRTAIRKAVVAALQDLATTGENVFDGRTVPVAENRLPALLVYAGGESINSDDVTATRLLERSLEITVEAVFKDVESLDDLGETILAEVETALGKPGVALGGAKSMQPEHIEIDRDGAGEQPGARMRLAFRLPYFTALGAPTVAL